MDEVAKFSYAKPILSMRPEDVQVFRERAIDLLKQLIRKKGKSPESYVIRDVKPKTDLGLTNEEWKHTYSASYTEETWIQKTLDDDRFLVIYGYTNTSPSPKTLYMLVKRGNVPILYIHTQAVHMQENPVALFNPEGFAEGEKITVLLYGDSTGDDKPVLLAVFAEPVKETIT